MVWKSRKEDPEFVELIKTHIELDEKTGNLKLKEQLYAQLKLNLTFKGEQVVLPYSHVVWLLKFGCWPEKGKELHHKNHDPLDNRLENLEEITPAENQKHRRGRMVYRSYGKGKYGCGINVTLDKRDGCYDVRRHLSRGHGNGELRTIRKNLGRFKSLEDAEDFVKWAIKQIEKCGPLHFPFKSTRRERVRAK